MGGTSAKRVFPSSSFGALFQSGGYPGAVNGKFTPDFDHVNGQPGILADEYVLLVSYFHVTQDGLQNLFAGGIGFPVQCFFQRPRTSGGRIFKARM
jgi:hypothetical protein